MYAPCVLEITLPVDGYSGPYFVLAMEEDGEKFVFFSIDVSEDASEPIWVATPLPKPLLDDGELLNGVAQKLYNQGYQLVFKNDITVH